MPRCACAGDACASDAEESALEGMEPIEPDEVLDLVDAQSASESADVVRYPLLCLYACLCPVPLSSLGWQIQYAQAPTAVHAVQSEESDAERETSSSRPGPAGRTLLPVVNKARPFVADTQHAGSKQPSALYPLRSSKWRAPVTLAQLNSAAAIASTSTGLTTRAHISSFNRYPYPPPVFATAPPPPPPVKPAAPKAPSPCKPSYKAAVVDSHATDGIPPPCEPEAGQCDWSAVCTQYSFYPTDFPAAPTFQPPSKKASKPLHAHMRRFLAAVRPTAQPGSTAASQPGLVNSAKLLHGTIVTCAAAIAPTDTPQCAPAVAASMSAYAPHVDDPVSRNTTPGNAATSSVPLTANSAASQPVPEQQHRTPDRSRVRDLENFPFRAGPELSPFSVLHDDAHLSLMDTNPSPVTLQPLHSPSPKPLAATEALRQQTQSGTVHSEPQPANCNPPAQPTTATQVAEARDPLSDLLGEIDQFILTQNDACMLPEDTFAAAIAPLSATKPPQHAAGAGTSSAPSNITCTLQPAGLLLAVKTASNSNGENEQEFVPQDADFQPLTPRTPHSSNDEDNPPCLSPTDWEAVFPMGVDADPAWGLDAGSNLGFISPEMSLLSPMLHLGLQPSVYGAAARTEPAVMVSPEVCRLPGGAAGGATLSRDVDASPAATVGCAAQGLQPHVNGTDGRGGAASCVDSVMTGRRAFPPVARRLDLDFTDAAQQDTYQQQQLNFYQPEHIAHASDPFSSPRCDDDSQHDAKEDENASNQCDTGSHVEASVEHENPNDVDDELQELLDEVDAAVACRLQHSTPTSTRRDSILAGDQHDAGVQKVQRTVVSTADSSGERLSAHQLGNEAVNGSGSAADVPQRTDQECGQHADDAAAEVREVGTVCDASSLDRGIVGDTSLQYTAKPAASEDVADAAAIIPDCFEDLGDDDLYRLCAAPL